MRTLYPTGWLRLFILGVILVFLGGCAALKNLTIPTAPEYGELVMHFEDGDIITYVLPPEFPQLNEDELELYPISMLIWIARQEIDGDVYGIFLWAPEAVGLGCAMILDGKDDRGQYWAYDAQGIPQPCTEDELNIICFEWSHIQELPPVEPETEAISI